MARIRSIKPGFFASEDVSALPLRARLTWIGLWTHCDDQGRAKDHAKLIKAAVWPLDAVTLGEIEEDLATLAAHQRIVRYQVDGKRYLEVVNWHDHQRPNKPTLSRLPAPPPMNGWHPPDDSHEPFPDDSGSTPVELPDNSRSTPDGRGEEGSGVGEESSAGARASQGREQLQRMYYLDIDQATLVMKKIDYEMRDPVRDWPSLIDRMYENGSLLPYAEAVQHREPAPRPSPELYAVPDPPEPEPESADRPPAMPRDQSRAFAHLSTCKAVRCPRCVDIADRWPDLKRSGT